jgi:uncharacterized SAM-binding protein YcdF (DUF218 family)
MVSQVSAMAPADSKNADTKTKSSSRKPNTRLFFALACLFVVMAMSPTISRWVLIRATAWLLVGQPPEKSDLLVVLAGATRERVQTGADLYLQGMAPLLTITGDGYSSSDILLLEQYGVPREALVIPPNSSRSTYEDALSLRQLILEKKVVSVLVVTSPYHCRRARLILNRVLSGLGVRVTVTPSVSLFMDPDHWWSSPQGWVTEGAEFPKIAWAWMTVPTLGDVSLGAEGR